MYVGKIKENEEHEYTVPSVGINVIDNLLISDISCGASMIVVIDHMGYLYLYNDKEKLFLIKLNELVRSIFCFSRNFYAISQNNEFLYEFVFTYYKYNFSNYIQNVYSINPHLKHQLNFINVPFFSENAIFFTSGKS